MDLIVVFLGGLVLFVEIFNVVYELEKIIKIKMSMIYVENLVERFIKDKWMLEVSLYLLIMLRFKFN